MTEGADEVTQGLIPVRDPGREKPEEEIALRLSGGGYRAMLFHLGRLIRLNETGHLKEIARVSSVSGGSITAGVLGLASKHLDFGIGGIASNLDELVVKPVRKLAGKTIDNPAIFWGLLLPWRTASGMLASYYAEYLFGGRTVQDLSDDSKGEGPRFVFNATNVQTGKLFRDLGQRHRRRSGAGAAEAPAHRLLRAQGPYRLVLGHPLRRRELRARRSPSRFRLSESSGPRACRHASPRSTPPRGTT